MNLMNADGRAIPILSEHDFNLVHVAKLSAAFFVAD